ncbi:cytochrome P450 [Cantharellus anzutake]|uniref:cytochrome P450 n=1 Tax=Cantharellus anzutake TaxID=1750568 RepID=UPI001904FAC0|nr:cytochrome P450 [Cantharellus anzutake]KAF8331980.1 cytochrome P450 [Cantharellus anzutake]
MATIFERNYRLGIVVDIAKALAPPAFASYVIVHRILPPSIVGGFFYQACWHYWIIAVFWLLWDQFEQWKGRREAERMSAVYLPRVKGKWLGNLDLGITMLNGMREGYMSESLEQFFGDNETINFGVFWTDVYVSRNPAVAQTVLTQTFENFQKGSELRSAFYGMLGQGIFASDGARAKAHRAVMRPFFSKDRVRDFNTIDRYVDKALALMQERATQGLSIDVQDLFGRFTMDAAGEFLFGSKDFNTLDQPLAFPGKGDVAGWEASARGPYGELVQAFDRLQEITAIRGISGKWWALQEFWTNKTRKHSKIADSFLLPLVIKALENKKLRGDKKCDIQEGDFIDHLVDATTDIKEIRDELYNVLVASQGTTAVTLAATLYLLSLHPEVVVKAREEVMTHLPVGTPTYDDIRKMVYLRGILNEALRLFPPNPLNARTSKTATLIPGDQRTGGKPIYVPAEKRVCYIALALHSNKDIWGDNADQFVPERWVDGDKAAQRTPKPQLFAFGGGPRICPGQEFAYIEASLMLIRMFQIFDKFALRQREDAPPSSLPPKSWRGAPGRKGIEEIWPTLAVVLSIKGGVWVQMGLAQNDS